MRLSGEDLEKAVVQEPGISVSMSRDMEELNQMMGEGTRIISGPGLSINAGGHVAPSILYGFKPWVLNIMKIKG